MGPGGFGWLRGRALVPALWLAGAVAICAVLVGPHYDDTWFFADEWGLIFRSVSPEAGSHLERMFSASNGRLWAANYALYTLQIQLFGLDSYLFVHIVLCITLVALTVSTAWMLRALGVPPILGFAVGVVLTYLGPAALMASFANLFTWNLALALAFVSMTIVIDHRAGWLPAGVVSALLLVTTVSDSGIAALVVVLLAVFAGIVWRNRFVLVAVVPAAAVIAVWNLSTPDVTFPPEGSVFDRARLVLELIARSAGALVAGGLGEGIAALVVGGAVVVFGIVRGHVRGQVLAATVAGTIAAVVAAVAVVETRGGLVPKVGFFGRYLTIVGAMLVVAAVPAMTATLRTGARVRDRALAAFATAAVVVVFVLNLSTFQDVREQHEARASIVRTLATHAVAVVEDGCPGGAPPNLAVPAFEPWTPGIPLATIARLVDMGALEERAAPGRTILWRACGVLVPPENLTSPLAFSGRIP